MIRLAIFVLLSVFTTTLKAQKGTTISILFSTDLHTLSQNELNRLEKFLVDGDCEFCFIELSGHTDSMGSDQYNELLAKRRVSSVVEHISKFNDCLEIREKKGFGESKPIASNRSELTRSKNRRVEVVLTCNEPEIVEEEPEELSEVWPFFPKFTGPVKQVIDCNTKDVFEIGRGVRVVVDEHAYSEGDEQVELTMYSCMDRRTAFKLGFTTQTQDGLLESAGMFKVVAKINGKEVQPLRPDAVRIYIPMDDQTGFEKFNSYSEEHYTLWEEEKKDQEKSGFTPADAINRFYNEPIDEGGNVDCNLSCPFFWCGLKTKFSARYRNSRSRLMTNCVSENRDLMDTYDLFSNRLKQQFPRKEDFARFLIDNDRETAMEMLNEKIPRFEEFSFFKMNISSGSWINCDRFVNEKNKEKVVVDEPFDSKSDIRLFFDDIFSIMRAKRRWDGKILFDEAPIGAAVTLVIVKKIKDQMMMSRESFKVGQKPKVNFKPIEKANLENIF